MKISRWLFLAATLIFAHVAHAAGAYDCLIEPTQMVEIRAPVVGVLEHVNVNRGDRVTKGQVLANLESSSERAATELALFKSQMVGPIQTAESKLEFARRKYERRRDMAAKNFLSDQDREDAESDMKQAEAELRLAQENKQVAKLEWQQQNALLELRTIRSPFNGVVVDRMLDPGEVIEPGDQKKAILKLAEIDPLRVHVILPMALFERVHIGTQGVVTPEAPMRGRYKARVVMVDRLIDAASGTLGVFLELPNPRFDIPAGVKCRVDFTVGSNNALHPKRPSTPSAAPPRKP